MTIGAPEVVVAPFASKVPFQLLLMPKGHHADFAVSSEEDLHDLAGRDLVDGAGGEVEAHAARQM